MAHPIVVNEEAGRFELQLEAGLALLTYELDNNMIALMHTEVPPEEEGQGIASELAAFAFDFARKNDLKVKIYCRFMQVFLQRHPELQDQVIS